MITKRRHWSEEDDKYLLENMDHRPVRELALDLSRTEKAVRRRIDNLGHNLGKINFWTDEEEGLLDLNYNKPIDELIKLFPKRSKTAIIGKLHRINKV